MKIEKRQALRIYDLLREAHKSVRQARLEFRTLAADREMALDAVDNTIYLAEAFFVREAQ